MSDISARSHRRLAALRITGRSARPAVQSPIAWIRRLVVGVLCAAGLGWLAPAVAAPSTECPTPVSATIASGGSHTFDFSSCSVFGLDGMPVLPSHGTVSNVNPSTGNGTGLATYVNNGDGAPSDTFTVLDDSNGSIVVNVTIQGAAPVAGAVSASVQKNSANNVITLNLSGGTATSVAVATGAAHGTATASGTTIRYTPTAFYAGSDSFTYTATNSNGTSSPATVTVTVVNPTITVSPTSLSAATAGTAYSQVFTASGGVASYTFSYISGSLPSGVTLSSSGVLSGTPTASGTFNFTIVASDANTNTGARAFTWVVNPGPPIAGAVSASVQKNSSNNAITLNLSGGTATSVAVATGAAHGTATASGTNITYTPTASYTGSDSFTYTATNSSGTSSPATVTVTVSAPTITVSPTSLPDATGGTAYSQIFSASGGVGPYTFSYTFGSLPAGVALSPSGALTGTPTTSGTFTFTIVATDANTNTGTRAYVWFVNPAPPVAGAVSATVAANSSNNAIALNLSGGAPVAVSVVSAAAHGTATATGTTITYTPTAGYSGSDSFTYTATNISGTSSPATVTVTVSTPTITLSPTTVSSATVGTAYSQAITANGGAAPYAYAVTAGALPGGTTLSSGGTLSGTPTASGSFNFTVTATDNNGNTGARAYAWTVNPPPPIAGAVTLTVTTNSSNNPVPLNLSGGTAVSVAVSNAANHGTTAVSGTSITYTPAAGYAGSDSFAYTATNAGGTSSPGVVQVFVNVPTIVFSPTTVPAGTAGSAYAPQTLTASGGTGPYTYTVYTGGLPAGMTLSSAGVLSGTPTASGSFNFNVRATDSNNATGFQVYTLSVNPGPPIANPVTRTVAANSSNINIPLNVLGGNATSVAVASAPSHGTAVASGTLIRYTPTAGYSGPDSFTYTATNANGTSAPATVTLTVSGPTIALSPTSLAAATLGTAASQAITASGGAAPYTYAVTAGALPAGVALSSSGTVGGTPTTAGTFGFTVTATDANGNSGSRAFSLVVQAAAPAPPAVVQTIAANASSIPLTLQLTGTHALSVVVQTQPAHGTAVAQGLDLLYTPAPNYTGSDTFTYGVTTAAGTSAPAAVTITVSPLSIAIAPAALPPVAQGHAVAVTLQASGGVAPYRFDVAYGALPAGVSLTTAGVLSGSSSVDGLYAFTVIATDANGVVQSRDYTMRVALVARADPSKDAAVIGVVSSQLASTDRFTEALLDNVSRHLDQIGSPRDVCSDLVTVGTSAAGAVPSATPRVFGAAPARPAAGEPAAGGRATCTQAGPFWIGGSLQHGRQTPTGSVGDGFSTSGVTLGVDLPGPAWLGWGAAIDYGSDRSDSDGLAAVNRAHSLLLTLYGRVTPLPWMYVDGVAGAGRLAFTSRRPGDAAGAVLAGDRDGAAWFGSIRVGHDLRHDAARLTTYLRADLKVARLDQYSESGEADTALTYRAMRWTTRAVTAGARASWDIPLAAGVLSPGADVSFRHTGANQPVQHLFYEDLGATSQTYDLATSAAPQSTATVTAGFKLRVRNGVVVAVDAGWSGGSSGLRQVGGRTSVQFGF